MRRRSHRSNVVRGLVVGAVSFGLMFFWFGFFDTHEGPLEVHDVDDSPFANRWSDAMATP